MADANKRFSLLTILLADYSSLFSLTIPFVLVFSHILVLSRYMPDGSGLGFTEADESDIISSQIETLIFSTIAIAYFVIRIRFFYILYKRGVEVPGTIIERGIRIEYEYVYNSRKYLKGNSLSFAFKENDYQVGQEIILCVDPKKPTRAIIEDIYFSPGKLLKLFYYT